jgi:predicted enzyme related to lactoylglutathione lyase
MTDSTELEAGLVGIDRHRLESFYHGALGFEVSAVLDYPQGTVVRLRRDAARLKLFFPSDPAVPPPPTDTWHHHAGFRYAAVYLDAAETVDTTTAAVVEGGGQVVAEPTDHGPAKRIALVTDPEQNLLELIWED